MSSHFLNYFKSAVIYKIYFWGRCRITAWPWWKAARFHRIMSSCFDSCAADVWALPHNFPCSCHFLHSDVRTFLWFFAVILRNRSSGFGFGLGPATHRSLSGTGRVFSKGWRFMFWGLRSGGGRFGRQSKGFRYYWDPGFAWGRWHNFRRLVWILRVGWRSACCFVGAFWRGSFSGCTLLRDW